MACYRQKPGFNSQVTPMIRASNNLVCNCACTEMNFLDRQDGSMVYSIFCDCSWHLNVTKARLLLNQRVILHSHGVYGNQRARTLLWLGRKSKLSCWPLCKANCPRHLLGLLLHLTGCTVDSSVQSGV